jgi:putative endonuclease
MSWFVYVLRCADDSLYTGITTDKARRLAEHNKGIAAKYTRVRTPVEMVYSEDSPDRSTATKREMAIKKLTRAKKIQLIQMDPQNEKR